MVAMANPDIPDFGSGWLPVVAILLVAALLVALKLTSRADSPGGRS